MGRTREDEIFIRVMLRVVADGNGCYIWTGARTGRDRNYGHINIGMVDGKYRYKKVHVIVWEYIYGPVPKDKVLDHLCQNGICVFPLHFELVTNKVNILRGSCPSAINARKDEYIYGHLYTMENTYRRPGKSGRECRICLKARNDRRCFSKWVPYKE